MSTTGRTIRKELSLSRDGGRADSIGVELSFSLPPTVSEFTARLSPEVLITSTEGFRPTGSKLKWDQQTPTPRVKGRFDPSRTSSGGLVTIDRGGWAIVSRPTGGVNLNWRYRGSELGFEERYSIDGQGVISSDGSIAYLGPFDRYSMNEESEKFELVIPNEAELWHEPAEILESLTGASRYLNIGPHNDRVLAIAAPADRSNWGPTGTQFGDEGFWALDNIRLDHPNNTWIHEYVHTRQQFECDDSLAWLVEGTANYFSAWMGVEQGRIDVERFRSYITHTTDPDAVLADPSTWENSQTKYTKGTTVTAAFAAELRNRTNGEVELMGVLRHLCRQDKELSYADFRSIVSGMGVPRITGWLDRYVAGSRLPVPPRDSTLYGFNAHRDRSSRGPNESTTSPNGSDSPSTDADPEQPEDEDMEPDQEDDGSGLENESASDAEEEDSGGDEESQSEEGEVGEGNCPVCRAINDEEATYCGNCGTAIRRTCFVCGSQAPGQEYCPTCGTELVTNCAVCGHKQRANRTYCEKCGTEQ